MTIQTFINHNFPNIHKYAPDVNLITKGNRNIVFVIALLRSILDHGNESNYILCHFLYT